MFTSRSVHHSHVFSKKCKNEFEIFGVFMENTALFEIIMDKQMKIYLMK